MKPDEPAPIVIAPSRAENDFSRLLVGAIMRRQILHQPASSTLRAAITLFIKHKSDALLVVDGEGLPVGVVTKTEVMAAYFGELPLSTCLGDIMAGPVISCAPTATLHDALLVMQDRHIHRIYVIDPASHRAVGTLSYPDIVGVLYRYCCRCEMSLYRRRRKDQDGRHRLSVAEVMHRSVISAPAGETVEQIIGLLASYRIGALLLVDEAGQPTGVLSKTDLILAYRRGVPLGGRANTVMQPKIRCCRESDELEEAIRQMIFAEVSRLFVTGGADPSVVGVLTLTDGARARSGSCRACTNSRIIPKG